MELLVMSFVLEMCCSWWNSSWNCFFSACWTMSYWRIFVISSLFSLWKYLLELRFILLADVARGRCINQAMEYLITFVVVKIPQFSGKMWLHTHNYYLVFILQNSLWILNRFHNCHIWNKEFIWNIFINILILQSKHKCSMCISSSV